MNQKYLDFLIRDWQQSDRNTAAGVIKQVLEEYEAKWRNKWLKVQFQGYGVNGVPIFPVWLGLRETDDEGNIL